MYDLAQRQVHLDFHTSEAIKGIGSKFDKENFLPLLLGAICKSTDADTIDIALGLPIIQFKDKETRTELINMLQGNAYKVFYNNVPATKIIRSVQVFPEGISGYLFLKNQGLLKHFDGLVWAKIRKL